MSTAHPDYEFSCLVRNSEKGAEVGSQYAKVKLVYGTLDDTDVLRQEAKHADVVMSQYSTLSLLNLQTTVD